MTDPEITRLRASSTPSFAQCELMWAVRTFPKEFRAAGYTLRDTSMGIAASIGTAVHAGAEEILSFKLAHGHTETVSLGNNPTDRAIGALHVAMNESELTFDKTAPSGDAAERHVIRMVNVFRRDLAPKLNPYKIEDHVEFDLDAERFPGIVVSGRVDLVENETDGTADLKTRAMTTSSDAHQLGVYNLQRRTLGQVMVRSRVLLIPRTSLRKEQPPAMTVDYDVHRTERLAYATLHRMAGTTLTWRATKDPLSFLPNPATYLCSAKFCAAWGTDTCPAWRPDLKPMDNDE